MRSFLTLLVSLFFVNMAFAQELTTAELLERSMAFHDPDSKWEKCRFTLVVDMEIPGRPVRSSQIVIDNEKGTFDLSVVQRGSLLQWSLDGLDSAEMRLNFREPTPEMADSLSLTAERARRWRDYYGYLYGLPMKLTDSGTNIQEGVIQTTFMNKEVLALKVTYGEAVGSDVWYSYFSPDTYAMVGYRFYHDEAKNDGEYIVLDGMTIHNGMRIPKDRTWYTNAEDRLLGTDMLIGMEVKRYWD